jgi:hypothetical protein
VGRPFVIQQLSHHLKTVILNDFLSLFQCICDSLGSVGRPGLKLVSLVFLVSLVSYVFLVC